MTDSVRMNDTDGQCVEAAWYVPERCSRNEGAAIASRRRVLPSTTSLVAVATNTPVATGL